MGVGSLSYCHTPIVNVIFFFFTINVFYHIKIINKKSIILDRDGVINYDYGYVHKYKKFKFKPGVIMALKYLKIKIENAKELACSWKY